MSKAKAEEAVKVIDGNLVLIPLDVLKIAEFAAEAEGDFTFSNPRHFKPGRPGIDGEGFDPQSMDELREAIRTRGLQQPLVVRSHISGKDKEYQVVAGERRYRCVSRMYRDNSDCFDSRTGKMVPASELYKYIECRVYDELDDIGAMELAYTENSTSIGIGESASFNLFRYWRRHGFADKQILNMTKKTTAWVRHMDIISRMGNETPDCLEAYLGGKINQTVALTLAEIEDPKARIKICDRAMEFAHDQARGAIEKAEVDYREAVADHEVARGTIRVAARQSQQAEEEAEAEAAKTARKAEVKLRNLEKVKRGAQAKNKDVVAAAREITGKKPKRANVTLRAPSIQKNIIDPAVGAMEREGYDEKKQWVGDPAHLQLVIAVAMAISEGKCNLPSIMEDYYAQYPMDEEYEGEGDEYEYEEDEYEEDEYEEED